ncbi:MAG: integration host factor subunit beta [Thermoguttaceae bacterium]|nr:integration host factor subunit beta [Thermoguttaceae bacterium]
MTKKEIVRAVSEEMGLTQQATKEIVQKTFEVIIDMLCREKRIEIRNFGVFEVRQRKPRKARNPKTSQQVVIPARMVVSFHPGKVMEDRVSEIPAEIE